MGKEEESRTDLTKYIIAYIRKDMTAIIILLIALLILMWTFYANQSYSNELHEYYKGEVGKCYCPKEIKKAPIDYTVIPGQVNNKERYEDENQTNNTHT